MHALIAGGGIAGAVAAMALEKVGIRSTLYEGFDRHDPDTGSYFTVTANGLEALGEIGVRHLALQAGFPTTRNILWNGDGKRLVALPLDSTLRESPPAHTLKRSRLVADLQTEAVTRGIPLLRGRRLETARRTNDGKVEAYFDDGSTAAGDLLIGADGVHSVVRKAIDPSAPDGRYVGLTNFGGFTLGVGDDIEPEAWHLVFGHKAFFGYQATPGGDVVWFANVPGPIITREERARISSTEWSRRLIDLFQDDVGPASDLIESGSLELYADNTHDLGHVPTWHRDSMIIIGDAAHAPAPTSGQGASMAIEDGLVLAKALRDTDSIGEGFEQYESLRRERVEKIVAVGARGSSNKIPGRWGRFGRDLALRYFLKRVVTEQSLAWIHDYRVRLDHSAVGRPVSAT